MVQVLKEMKTGKPPQHSDVSLELILAISDGWVMLCSSRCL